MAIKSREEIAHEVERARYQKLEEFAADPYIGYASLDDALKDYKLSSQAEVLARLLNKENVFISGPAGSGKTTIINRFIELLDAEYHGDFEVAVTASTGIAAILIGGQTIHSWSGMGISTEPFNPKKIEPMMWNKAKQLKYTDVLIIDEISMLPAYLFDKLDAILKHFRRNKKPFGGIQLVLTGDFLQLPPVRGRDVSDDVNTDFAILTDSWKSAQIKYCYMDKTHRATDKKLKYVLNRMAADKVDDITKKLVKSRESSLVSKDPEKTYTTLFTTNKNVEEYNTEELKKNPNKLVTINSTNNGSTKDIEKILKNNGVEKTINLKVGATVMLTTNLRDPITGSFYANGSIGVIETFLGTTPRVRFNDGKVISIEKKMYSLVEKRFVKNKQTGQDIIYEDIIAYVSQIPLKLGYAITVHKSQGQTFDGVIVDLSKCFTPGLGYVALSRVRTMEDLIISGFTDKAYLIDPRSKKIADYVKRNALESRKEFEEKISDYDLLLTNSIYRSLSWQTDKAGGVLLRRDPLY